MPRHRKRLLIILAIALAIGAVVAFIGGPAGWNPDITMGLALVLVVALSGWAAQNPGLPLAGTKRRQEPHDARA